MSKKNVRFYKAGSNASYSSVLALSAFSTFCHGMIHQKRYSLETYPLITDSNIQNKKMYLLLSFLFLKINDLAYNVPL